MKLQTRLNIIFLLLGICILSSAGFFISYEIEQYFLARFTNELDAKIRSIEYELRTFASPQSSLSYEQLQQLSHSLEIRVTFIRADGVVVFDSEVDEKKLPSLENHRMRPEVFEALRKGKGVSQHRSGTLNVEMMYLARKINVPLQQTGILSTVAVLRGSIHLTEVHIALQEIRSKIFFASGIIFIFIIFASNFISKKIARPINAIAYTAEEIRAGKLEKRIAHTSKDEIGKLAAAINAMVQKLNDDIVQLKKLERVRSEFLGNVSHELRTPIFALQTALETLLNGAIDDKKVNVSFLQKAMHHSQRLNALLSDLIEISRIESGEMKMMFRYFSLREFFNSVLEEVQLQAEQKNISLECISPSQSVEVFADKERIKQVMLNLIENAIKYTSATGKIIIAYAIESNGVRIIVTDTGCGIAEEHLPRIFERFYRIDKDRSRDVGGTGLGLAIVKHIIEAHESKVEVQSEIGKGSVFSFVLRRNL